MARRARWTPAGKGWSPQGKVGVVTGAAGGIGIGLVNALRTGGATVIATDVAPGPCTDVPLDVRDPDAFDTVVQKAIAEHGRIDFLFNNAGIAFLTRVEDATAEHWQRIIDINLWGVINGVRAVYPTMISQGHGLIVNTASVAGLIPSPMLTAYSTTKHAVVGLSTSLRVEAAEHGVAVHVVCPGPIETPLLDTRGPTDLPDITGSFDPRKFLTSIAGGKAYPADALAADVLAGIAKGRPIIVAPRSARVLRGIYRAAPATFIRIAGKGTDPKRFTAK